MLSPSLYLFIFTVTMILVGPVIPATSQPLQGVFTSSDPIWHPLNRSAHFVYFRSPEFSMPSFPPSAQRIIMHITARQSPHLRQGAGTLQGKLVCSFKLYINGVVVTTGPGHNLAQPTSTPPRADSSTQAVSVVDITDLLHQGVDRSPLSSFTSSSSSSFSFSPVPPSTPPQNVISIATFFNYSFFPNEIPRVQAEMCFSADGFSCLRSAPLIAYTSSSWQAWQGDLYHNPDGDSNLTSWYQMANENLDQREFPHGWTSEHFFPPPHQKWVDAIVQPPFCGLLYLDTSPPSALLTRTACNITPQGADSFLIDYGQEFSGGVNLSFPCTKETQGKKLTVILAETLYPNGTIYAPSEAKQFYKATWTLAGQTKGEIRDTRKKIDRKMECVGDKKRKHMRAHVCIVCVM